MDARRNRWFHPCVQTAGGECQVCLYGLEYIASTALFEVFSQRYERGSTFVATNLPFDEWTEMFGSERLTGALLDRLTHHVHIIEMNGDSYRLRQSSRVTATSS